MMVVVSGRWLVQKWGWRWWRCFSVCVGGEGGGAG